MVEKEALFGSKPSPTKSSRKIFGTSAGGGSSNKRFSVGGMMLQNSYPEKAVHTSQFSNKSNTSKLHVLQNFQPHGGTILSSGTFFKTCSQFTTTPLPISIDITSIP
mgnify:FL=1